MRKKTPTSVLLSKARLDAEMRAVVARMSHRPVEEICDIIRQRMNVSADPQYIRELVGRKA
jgi:hypothetical protein